ncbi:inverse autotransporter beta domain-containing protein [Candidatus Arsenophonus triatominarum]|uniref:inverse autotransporter beta domain-containing protein n=1 Tax=Candidatus Arsenophonus triatominarum TaxID=57911 RepID=UPI001FE12E71|nr:invasin domain 3-containing protein [Candidatus Arsenophonus triatominarum]
MAGIQSLVEQNKNNNPYNEKNAHQYSKSFSQDVKKNVDIKKITKSLPNLGSTTEVVSENKYEEKLASSISRLGNILSNDNSVDASINYARSIGEGLVNQKVNDWLNQYGKVRLSFSSDKTISGDFLLPIIDKPNSLLFTQLGHRNKTDRNTINIGLGYRQYSGNWMYGINTFYDYDYTGSNARLGLGGEAWIDYLKLAVNGYFGLTDWHQSKISVMEDYDERPATGFDIRTEAYLPKYPQLGGSLKYEKYFGKGVHLGTGADPKQLKDDAQALTMGLSYTPIPLLTLKAEHSAGDLNDTKISLDLNYRLGVPISEQIDPEAVDVMRSLVGNKYDFVDRNYDIVMQYRKQELISISVPSEITAQAKEKIVINATVIKSKYGLKDIRWEPATNFISNGGSYRKISINQVEVTLPPYIYMTKNNTPQEYQFTAVGIDNKGNESNKVITSIRVIPSKKIISELTITPENILFANDTDTYTVTAKTVNEHGQPIKNENLTFEISGLKLPDGESGVILIAGDKKDNKKIIVPTNNQGEAVVKVRSKAAGKGSLIVTMENGNYSKKSIQFIADKNTATITAFGLIKDNAIANGKDENKLKAIVKDKYGNNLSDISINLNATNNALILNSSDKTNADGELVVRVTNTKNGKSEVTANINNSKKNQIINFISGNADFKNSAIKVDNATYTAGNDMTVNVTLKDAQGNGVTGQAAALTSQAVTVANASEKSGVTWIDNGDGTYSRIYMASQSGSGLKARLKLADWTTEVQSADYAITAGAAVSEKSAIKVDNATYTAGNDMTVSVTLKDAQGNGVIGQAAALTSQAVTVANASEKSGVTWIDNGDGTYSRIYMASQSGSGLKARLKLADWTTEVQSADYAINAGKPVPITSTIVTDKTNYVAGNEMTISVTLKDAKGNGITGQAAALTSQAVTVANASEKDGVTWIDNGDGTYSRIYMASQSGSGLKARLKLADWATEIQSADYAITAGAAVPEKSAIKVDNTTYTAGNDMTVSVTLKDAQGNGVTGQAVALTSQAVTVANASEKDGVTWIDNGDGTYSRRYMASQSGRGLKARLKLADWATEIQSADYAITAGAAVPEKSAIKVDNTTYTAGNDMTVSVTLKDAQGNGVTGQAVALTSQAVTVANASEKSGVTWIDNGDGTYSRIYMASQSGRGLKARLKLADWTTEVQSADYAITAGAAVSEKSAIKVDNATYTAGNDMTVSVTLKDAQGNGITGQAVALTSQAVTVANASEKDGVTWIDNGDGTYSRIYMASQSGRGLKARLKLADWTTEVQSADYAITAGAAVSEKSAIKVDNTTYTAGNDMTVSVTLKDAQGNGVTGQAVALTSQAVTVANASEKSGVTWIDNGDGTYSRRYMASQSGRGLKARLKLADWATEIQSADYAITAGAAVSEKSAIKVDNATYTAGNDMTISVTLKDAQGNGVIGQAAALTSQAVTVANASEKSGVTWIDNGDGTYSRRYMASQSGRGLKARLKLADWATEIQSADYAITAGAAVPEKSAIKVDNATYTAGNDMTVSVTLKDAQGNGVTGQVAALTSQVVTVANASEKDGVTWIDNGDGTYSRIYMASQSGRGLKARLKLADWTTEVQSADYAITAGKLVPITSTIVTDKTNYVAGDEMTISVTLKDAQGNGITGQAAALTSQAVTVANASEKDGVTWIDNGDGTYSRIYMASQSGRGLKARLKLADWATEIQSADYAITAGAAVPEKSAIKVDNTTYTAGNDMTVSVTLKDAQGNGVTGQAVALTSQAVTVANASEKDGVTWIDNGDGTYSRIYMASQSGRGLKARLKLADWTTEVQSADYAITAGKPGRITSTIVTDKTNYVAGDEMTISVTLKDAQGNGITGQAVALTSQAVTVANASEKDGVTWIDNGDGTYSRIYMASQSGRGLKARLKLADWTTEVQSADYAITAGAAVSEKSAIKVDNATYTAGNDMTVSVTLKDAQGNGVTGQAVALTSQAVTVANASEKDGVTWIDNGDGTYSRIYMASQSGRGLKARLKLADWATEIQSADYAITAGAAVSEKSAIKVDNTTYTAGNDMTVSVTLKDAQGNGVTGQAVALTSQAVTVANASEKDGVTWIDNGDGTYSRIYMASQSGRGLKARLKLADWATEIQSADYAITAGAAVSEKSAIKVDNTTYTAGNDMTVSVTLKDAQGNGVTGQAVALTSQAVTVANASEKDGVTWIDNGDGTYSRRYMASQSGRGLKARLKLADWATEIQSADYAITAGAAVPEKSAIKVDNATYTAGNDMTVNVTLKDAQGNGVTGQAAALTSQAVTVANASEKDGVTWIDNGDGTYSRIYMASQSGSGLKARLKLADWTTEVQSADYAINAGKPVPEKSAIKVDNATYTAGNDMTISVTLKDAQGHGVTGQAAALTSQAVTVANASEKDGVTWIDNGDGTYSRTYMASQSGRGLKARLKLADWTTEVQSADYAITAGAAVSEKSAIKVDNTTYTAGNDMTISVTLKDAQGNGVTGQAAALTSQAVTVANASEKDGVTWIDNGDGTYSRIYMASQSGRGLKARLKLADWTTEVQSADYAITAGKLVPITSTIVTDKTNYVAGDEMTISVTLKDAQGNGITGQAAALTSQAVTVANASEKDGVTWIDNGDGTYSRIYMASQSGSGLKARLKLADWTTEVQSADYAITADSRSAKIEVVSKSTAKLIPANGDAENPLEITIVDNYGNPVGGYAITVNGNKITTDTEGVAKYGLKSNQYGENNVDVISASNPKIKANIKVKFSIPSTNIYMPF